MPELEHYSRPDFLTKLEQALQAAKMGNEKGIVGIGVVRALTTYYGVYRDGHEEEIKKLEDLLKYYPNYDSEDAKDTAGYKKVYDLLWKDIDDLKRWLPVFNRNNKDENSSKIFMPRSKRKVRLLAITVRTHKSTMNAAPKIKPGVAKDTSEDRSDKNSPNIGNLTIQNSHDVTIAGRDVHIHNQTGKRTSKKSAEGHEESYN